MVRSARTNDGNILCAVVMRCAIIGDHLNWLPDEQLPYTLRVEGSAKYCINQGQNVSNNKLYLTCKGIARRILRTEPMKKKAETKKEDSMENWKLKKEGTWTKSRRECFHRKAVLIPSLAILPAIQVDYYSISE